MSDDTQLQAKTKQPTMTVAQRAEYAYQLGPKELAVFWLKLKGYDAHIHSEKEYHSDKVYHYYQSELIPFDYAQEEFLHFAESMAQKKNIELIDLSEQERARWIELARPLEDSWAKEIDARGLPGTKMVEEARRMLKE